MTATKTGFTTAQMTLTAIMTAVICVLGPLSLPIPVSPVPISLGSLGVLLAVSLLGWKLGTVSVLLYLVIGIIGVPVFASFSSGFAKLTGPTGGYLVGYLFVALICGYIFEKTDRRPVLFLGMIAGTAVLYLFGTLWLAYVAGLTFVQALWAGVIPYIPGDLAKIVLVLAVVPTVRRRLRLA